MSDAINSMSEKRERSVPHSEEHSANDFKEGEWYWDGRNQKAYFPITVEENRVELVTVWHRDEIEDALEHGAMVPLDEISFPHDSVFETLDSFRTPAETSQLRDDSEDTGRSAGSGGEP